MDFHKLKFSRLKLCYYLCIFILVSCLNPLHAQDTDGDGYSDTIESIAGTLTVDSGDFPYVDFSDSVDLQINQYSDLNSIESDIVLWLDATNIDAANNSSLTNGSAIENWVDLSGSGNNAYQTTDTNMPIYNDTGFNSSKASVEFGNGTVNDYLEFPANANSNNYVTVFAVLDGHALTKQSIIMKGDDSGSNDFLIIYAHASELWEFVVGSTESDRYITPSSENQLSDTVIVEIKLDTTGADMIINGTQSNEDISIGSLTNDGSGKPWAIGADWDSATALGVTTMG